MADTIEVPLAPVGLLVILDRFISWMLLLLVLGKSLPPRFSQASVQRRPLRVEFRTILFRSRPLDFFVDPRDIGLERNKFLALPQLLFFFSWERLGQAWFQ